MQALCPAPIFRTTLQKWSQDAKDRKDDDSLLFGNRCRVAERLLITAVSSKSDNSAEDKQRVDKLNNAVAVKIGSLKLFGGQLRKVAAITHNEQSICGGHNAVAVEVTLERHAQKKKHGFGCQRGAGVIGASPLRWAMSWETLSTP